MVGDSSWRLSGAYLSICHTIKKMRRRVTDRTNCAYMDDSMLSAVVAAAFTAAATTTVAVDNATMEGLRKALHFFPLLFFRDSRWRVNLEMNKMAERKWYSPIVGGQTHLFTYSPILLMMFWWFWLLRSAGDCVHSHRSINATKSAHSAFLLSLLTFDIWWCFMFG